MVKIFQSFFVLAEYNYFKKIQDKNNCKGEYFVLICVVTPKQKGLIFVMKKNKFRKENNGKNNVKPRFDKLEINKLKKDKSVKEENIDKLKKKVESKQNKKYKKK